MQPQDPRRFRGYYANQRPPAQLMPGGRGMPPPPPVMMPPQGFPFYPPPLPFPFQGAQQQMLAQAQQVQQQQVPMDPYMMYQQFAPFMNFPPPAMMYQQQQQQQAQPLSLQSRFAPSMPSLPFNPQEIVYQQPAISYGKAASDSASQIAPPASKKQKTEPEPAKPPLQKAPANITCDPCQKTFDNEKSYESHVHHHVKCKTCGFHASKKLVVKHMKSVHGSDGADTENFEYLGNNIAPSGTNNDNSAASKSKKKKNKKKQKQPANINYDGPEQRDQVDDEEEAYALMRNFKATNVQESPEDVERWIAERKRKYPSSPSPAKQSQKLEIKEDESHYEDAVEESHFLSSENNNQPEQDDSNEDDEEVPEETSTKVPPKQILVKTQVCNEFLNNRCKKGEMCQYIHKKSRKRNRSKQRENQRKRGDLLEMLADKITDTERECVYEATRYLLQENPFQFANQEGSNNESNQEEAESSDYSSSDDGED